MSIKIALNLKIFIITFVISVDFYIELLCRGDRMGVGDRIRLVIVYVHIYVLLLYYNQH